MSYKVCIPTAGTGSRLGDLTRFVNKSLVAIANRPTLSHLIEQFPDDVEFVVALGHKGDLVREFVAMAYPTRRFDFVPVTPYEGEGSGLGLSLLACRDHLREPFIFISCDTLVEEPIPPPDHDWMGGSPVDDAQAYRTIVVSGDRVTEIREKSASPPGELAYIGLAGIHDHAAFWSAMEQGAAEAIDTGESHGMRALVRDGRVQARSFAWHDTGMPASLALTRELYREPDAPNILEKANEAIWFVGDQVVKFSDDRRFISNRVQRVSRLEGFVPTVTASSAHMYRYAKVAGDVLSDAVTLPLFSRLLAHCRGFWRVQPLDEAHAVEFRAACLKFYRDKTFERVQLFYSNFGRADGVEPINGVPMPTLRFLLDRVDWTWLANGLPGRFHGDFHFENILWDPAREAFTFLDWRQDFAGDLGIGDIYYDLAKLLHGLIVSHGLIVRDLYSVDWRDDGIDFDLHRRQILVECENVFGDWLGLTGYDVDKVITLTALIYLNIAALHHHPYGLMLYALGKSMLARRAPRQTQSSK